jgi:hypothetical protein
LASSPICSRRFAIASTAMSSAAQSGPIRATYAPTLRALSAIDERISLSCGVIDHHRIALDSLRERRTANRRGQKVDIAPKEVLGLDNQLDPLAEAEAMAGRGLDEKVEVGVGAEVGAGCRAEGENPSQVMALGQVAKSTPTRCRQRRVEPPEASSVEVRVASPVGERSVDGTGEHAHSFRATAGCEVIEEALA